MYGGVSEAFLPPPIIAEIKPIKNLDRTFLIRKKLLKRLTSTCKAVEHQSTVFLLCPNQSIRPVLSSRFTVRPSSGRTWDP
jgi:hypothetical protein